MKVFENKKEVLQLIKSNSGYSLPTVLIIVFLIITILYGFTSILYFRNKVSIHYLKKLELKTKIFQYIDEYLYAGIDSNGVSKNEYSHNLKMEVEAKNLKDSLKNITIFGIKPPNIFENALIITRPNFRGTVTGNTKIEGNILVTKKRIKLGNIYGINSGSVDYLRGEILEEDSLSMRMIDFDLVNPISVENYLVDEIKINSTKRIVFDKGKQIPEKLKVSSDIELSSTTLLESNLRNFYYESDGKIIIKKGFQSNSFVHLVSNDSIIIEENSNISNFVMKAKKSIIINSNSIFKNVEVFSENRIVIKDSQFNYPSTIILFSDIQDSSKLNSRIEINNSTVNGSLILVSTIIGLPINESKIFIDESSKVHGIVYSENNCEIRGEIFGSVFTYNLVYEEDGNKYLNWLVNLKIDRTKLDANFLIPTIFKNDLEYFVINSFWE
ncbi:MAG: hypothetical protein K8F60_01645 [Melioribacteraceae bacterium]|nr:hypothetical protein [Melioribacteraceae bacterium]